MNRINLMIDMYATIAAMCFYHAGVFARGGYIDQAAEMTDRMLEAREQLKMWMKISQVIRGWKL